MLEMEFKGFKWNLDENCRMKGSDFVFWVK